MACKMSPGRDILDAFAHNSEQVQRLFGAAVFGRSRVTVFGPVP